MKFSARNISILLAVLFMAGIAFALYTLFQSEAQGIPNQFYLLLGISSVFGAAALVTALTNNQALVVYREKKIIGNGKNQNGNDSATTTISFDSLNAALKSARKPEDIMQSGLSAICKQLEAGQGAFYHVETRNEKKVAVLKAGYALTLSEGSTTEFEAGEGLIGQTIITGQTLYLDEIPEGYVKIISGLGSSSPRYILIVAATKDNAVTGVIELASFTPVTPSQRKFVEEAAVLLADKLAVN
jgi:methyl-accepting chemotaxis protein